MYMDKTTEALGIKDTKGNSSAHCQKDSSGSIILWIKRIRMVKMSKTGERRRNEETIKILTLDGKGSLPLSAAPMVSDTKETIFSCCALEGVSTSWSMRSSSVTAEDGK